MHTSLQGLFLDVMGAFETVWHKGLLAKLNHHNVTGKCLDLFQYYLNNRRQVVVVDGEKSQVLTVNLGIQQGLKLGPLLFILYGSHDQIPGLSLFKKNILNSTKKTKRPWIYLIFF